jgi:hypothetical protein
MSEGKYKLDKAWKTFLLRKLVLTNPNLGIISAQDIGVRFPPLNHVAISLLFVDLVSLLDQATSSQLTPNEFKRLGSLGQRLDNLASKGKIRNLPALHALRRRRNEVAHSLITVKREELDLAVFEVHSQLQAWRLIPEMPRFELALEVETDNQGVHLITLKVTDEGLPVFSRTTFGAYDGLLEQTIEFFGLTARWPD